MTSYKTEPVYNMKVVARETGMKADTLRAWERRYDLPKPDRTSGGHRLYSERDVEIIKWLMERQEEGLSISRAVELWRSLEADGQDPLRDMAYQPAEPSVAPAELPLGSAIAELREAWVTACLDFDELAAERVLVHAFALYPPQTVCIQILQKGLARIGELWHRNRATVQQEHFASALAIRRLDVLVEAAPWPNRPARILIGCPPEEEHTFGPLLLTLMLRRAGWDVLYLGANVPVSRFESTVRSVEPHLVILTAQQLRTAATLWDVAQVLQDEEVPLAFGGLIFNRTPALRRRIAGHFLGERLEDTLPAVERLLTTRQPVPEVTPASASYRQALAHYREQQADVEAQVWHTSKPDSIISGHLATANHYLADNIAAALKLGEMDFLEPELVWVETLIQNYDMDSGLLSRYLHAYHDALEAHLDERGRPILEWFERAEQ